MSDTIFKEISALLKQEMLLAMGCTEPGAIAYAGAVAEGLLSEKVEEAEISVSRDLIKNVQSVEIPNAHGRRGMEVALAMGLSGLDKENGLCLLEKANETVSQNAYLLVDSNKIQVEVDESYIGLHMKVRARSLHHEAIVEISGTHTNIIYEELDKKIILKKDSQPAEKKADYRCLSLDSIFAYIESDIPDEIKSICLNQVKYNYSIAKEGMTGNYGLNVGKTVISDDLWSEMRSYAAAGSDARMAGCTMPVIISAGSGNQGITIAVPLAIYAEKYAISEDCLVRADLLANLLSLYIKYGIGWLSGFCGAVSASCASACGIAYMKGMNREGIERVIINTLANSAGILCDGAKASCASKIATSLDSAFLGVRLAEQGYCCEPGSGIVRGNAEDLIKAIWNIGSCGMKKTDEIVVNLMLGN